MSGQSQSKTDLLGRAEQLDLLTDRIGRRVPVALVGEAGIGKTALLRAAAQRSRLPNFIGGGLPALTWMPYVPIKRALRQGALDGEPGSVAARVSEAVGDGLLVIDDLHWADGQTISVLSMLGDQRRVLTAIRREDAAADDALSAVQAGGFQILEVEPLGPADAAGLVRMRGGNLTETAIERIVNRAQGNALLLEELTAEGKPSAELELALTARLRHLSDEARAAMATIGLLGRPAPPALLGLGADQLLEAELVRVEEGNLVPRHALLAEAAARSLDDDVRRAIHSRLARQLEDLGEAARHHHEAGELDPAREKALAAAESSGSLVERASHLGVAAACSSGESADPLRMEAAESLIESGEMAQAMGLLDAVASTDPQTQAKITLLLSRALYQLGEAQNARTEVERGIRILEGRGGPTEVDLLIARARWSFDYQWNVEEGPRLAREAVAAASASSRKLAEATFTLGVALYASAHPDALHELTKALDLARGEDRIDLELDATMLLSAAMHRHSQASQAISVLESGIARARAAGHKSWELDLRWNKARILALARADNDQAIHDLQDVLSQPMTQRGRSQATSDLAIALADVGRPSEARELLESRLRGATHEWGATLLLFALAEVEWLSGRAEASMAMAATVPGSPSSPYVWAARLTAAWGAVLDLGKPFQRLITDGSPHAREFLIEEDALSLVLRSESLEQAEAKFLDAAEAWKGWVFRNHVRATWGAAEAARLDGRLDRARELLLAVEPDAEQHGLRPLLARIQRSLRQCGVRRTSPGGEGAEGLSRRETDILLLVAEGLTSTQIAARLGLAPSTVDSHVKSAMRKLGAKTRAQAAASITSA